MPAYYIDGKIKPFNYPALLNEKRLRSYTGQGEYTKYLR